MEKWKDIKNYEGIYQISNFGRVKRIGNYSNQFTSWNVEKILKPGNNGKGYLFVQLSKNCKVKRYYIHRLVAEAFIPNPLLKETINHIDGDKSNNHYSNLEWNTYSENNIHSIKKLGRDMKNKNDSIPVLQFTKDGKFIKEYPSMREAERQTGIKAIYQVCLGKKYRKTAGGYIWKYKQ